MRKLALVLAFIMLMSSLTACAREGFKDSLGQRDNLDPVKVEAEKDREEEKKGESEEHHNLPSETRMEFSIKEKAEGNVYIAYSLPEEGSEVGDLITEKIENILKDVVGSFDLSKEGSSLEVYDQVGVITEDVISLFYEGEYNNPQLKKPTKFAFGLNFNAKTGGQYAISELMQPHTLASLILDEQTSHILGDEEYVREVREELSQKGMSALADRIIAADTQRDLDTLFTFSFYMEKGRLVAIVPMEDDSKDPAYIEVRNEKV